MTKGELFSLLEGVEDDEEVRFFVDDDDVMEGNNFVIHSMEVEVINNKLDAEVILNLRKPFQ